MIAISVVLVVATLVAAVATSGSPEKTEAAKAAEAAVTAKIAHEVAAPEPSPPGTAPAPSEGAAAPQRPNRWHAELDDDGAVQDARQKAPAATSPHQPTPNATKLALSVPGSQLAYNTKPLTAKAGSVTITMTNMSPVEHNVTIAEGSKVLGATPTFVGGPRP